MGAVSIVNGDIRVDDLFLFPQECSGVRTVIDSLALNRFFASWVAAGRDPGQLRLWWHSHASLDVFWSSIDDGHIDEYRRNTWWLSIVGNHDGDLRARLDIFQPFRLAADWLPIVVDLPENPVLRAACQAEVTEKVAVPTAPAVPDLSLHGLTFEVPRL